ncbi:MAG: response regulator [Hasllibacter sp.]
MPALHGHTILVVEDEFLIALNLEMSLNEAGARVRLAATVDEAVRGAGGEVHAAILDVSLADGEVFPAADVLARRGLPFVFHSGHAAPEARLARYPGARALAKPAHEGVLLATLEEMLS